MKIEKKTVLAATIFIFFGFFIFSWALFAPIYRNTAIAQEIPAEKTAPTPTPKTEFNQEEALAKLREQIKGRENEPAEKVFKNIQNFKGIPAGRILAIMNFGYSRALGVSCTHCHMPEKWEAETKPTKQIAREMQVMSAKINDELLKNIKGFEAGRSATVNCTTCHRGEIKPALNLPMPKANP
jgi:hypothetical protein